MSMARRLRISRWNAEITVPRGVAHWSNYGIYVRNTFSATARPDAVSILHVPSASNRFRGGLFHATKGFLWQSRHHIGLRCHRNSVERGVDWYACHNFCAIMSAHACLPFRLVSILSEQQVQAVPRAHDSTRLVDFLKHRVRCGPSGCVDRL